MRRIFKFMGLLACVGGITFLSSCGNGDLSDSSSEKKGTSKEYDLLIYNSDSSISTQFSQMCEEYSSRTGVIVKCAFPEENENPDESLENYMNSGEAPDIFTVSKMSQLKKWQQSGNILDFSNATEPEFKDIANGIPKRLRLSSNTADSFGMPCTVEGYGYIIDPKMLSALFGGDKYRSVLTDLRACTYSEFESFINALKFYINGGQVYEFELNGNSYKFLESKTTLLQNLNGIFTFSAGTPVYTSYMIDRALAMSFDTAADVNTASNDKISSLSIPLASFASALDVVTSNMAGKNGALTRGMELVDTSSNSPTQSLKSFVNGNALFMIGPNSVYDSMFILDSSLANRVSFIPIKMPFEENSLDNPDVTQKGYNQSITVSVPMYMAINAKSNERQQKLAQNFFVWFKTSELAQKHILQNLRFIPYDIKESSTIDNQLTRSMIEYMSSDRILASVSDGFPDTLMDTLTKNIINNYYMSPSWSFDEYDSISSDIIKNWKKLK